MTEEPGRLQSMGSQSDLACICIAKSLHCPSEAITTLLISYTPIQNKEFGRKEAAELGLPKLSKHLYAQSGSRKLKELIAIQRESSSRDSLEKWPAFWTIRVPDQWGQFSEVAWGHQVICGDISLGHSRSVKNRSALGPKPLPLDPPIGKLRPPGQCQPFLGHCC